MGYLDVENFLLTVLEVLERVEDDLELILTVVIPLRTTDVGAKEEQKELFCTEFDGSWLEQMV